MNKDIILVISGEQGSGGGCWALRINQIANYINQSVQFQTKVITSPTPIFDGNLLQQCKGILVQRPFSPMPWLKNYKELQAKYGYKLSFECDDAFWNIIPKYSNASLHPRDWNAMEKIAEEQLKYFDCGIVTTEFLADYLHKHHNFWNTVIVPNVADKAIYHNERKNFFRPKPIVVSAGAGQHLMEPLPISPQTPVGIVGDRGDYCGEWVEWLRSKVKDIDLQYFMGVPYFLDEYREFIQLRPWTYTSLYSAELNSIRPDIIIAPLKNNDFNRAKSSLKFVEAAACGAVLMGSDFPNGPYEMIHPLCKVPDEPTVEQLNQVYNNIVNNWKEILDYQYDFINKNNWWLQSPAYIMNWINACSIPTQQLI